MMEMDIETSRHRKAGPGYNKRCSFARLIPKTPRVRWVDVDRATVRCGRPYSAQRCTVFRRQPCSGDMRSGNCGLEAREARAKFPPTLKVHEPLCSNRPNESLLLPLGARPSQRIDAMRRTLDAPPYVRFSLRVLTSYPCN